MAGPLPKVTHEYRNHHLDSTRWRAYQPREGDVVVTTSYKSGTTWMQQILHSLVFRGDPSALPVGLVSPWIDARFHGPLEEVAEGLAAQKHRRFVKSHLPLDGLPWYPEVRYVVVARDARDVFMSLWNHYRNYTDEMMGRLNGGEDHVGEPLPAPPPEDERAQRALWRQWMTRGWFPWETEGWPFWSNLHHTQSYWDFRHLENLLFVHYADLLADPAGQIRRVAGFVGESLGEGELAAAVEASSIDSMRKSMKPMDEMLKQAFKGGVDAFVYKGTNGRWRGVLGEEDLALYDEARRRVLTPDCAAWLEGGWLHPRGAPADRR
jgi:aryl sulfotransferase